MQVVSYFYTSTQYGTSKDSRFYITCLSFIQKCKILLACTWLGLRFTVKTEKVFAFFVKLHTYIIHSAPWSFLLDLWQHEKAKRYWIFKCPNYMKIFVLLSGQNLLRALMVALGWTWTHDLSISKMPARTLILTAVGNLI